MGKVTSAYTSRKFLDITIKDAQETLLGTPINLPTSEPAPQVVYTIADADLPSLSFTPYLKKWLGLVYAGGRFTQTGVLRTLYWRMLKNGGSVATGSSSSSSNPYYTVNAGFYDVAVGDVLAIALWASAVGVLNYDYKAYQMQVTRVKPLKKPYLSNLIFNTYVNQPNLVLGTPEQTAYGPYVRHQDFLTGVPGFPYTFYCLYVGDVWGFFNLYCGDTIMRNTASVRTSATSRPYYYANMHPIQIIFRAELK